PAGFPIRRRDRRYIAVHHRPSLACGAGRGAAAFANRKVAGRRPPSVGSAATTPAPASETGRPPLAPVPPGPARAAPPPLVGRRVRGTRRPLTAAAYLSLPTALFAICCNSPESGAVSRPPADTRASVPPVLNTIASSQKV